MSTMVIEMSFVMRSGPDVSQQLLMGPIKSPPKRTKHRCYAVHREVSARALGLAYMQGGTGFTRYKGRTESRAGTWLDDAPFTQNRCRERGFTSGGNRWGDVRVWP